MLKCLRLVGPNAHSPSPFSVLYEIATQPVSQLLVCAHRMHSYWKNLAPAMLPIPLSSWRFHSITRDTLTDGPSFIPMVSLATSIARWRKQGHYRQVADRARALKSSFARRYVFADEVPRFAMLSPCPFGIVYHAHEDICVSLSSPAHYVY